MAKNSELDCLNNDKAKLLEVVARAKLIRKLSSNRDFKKLVEDGYFKDAAADYAYAAGDLSLPREDRETTAEMSRAPGHFRRWLDIQLQMAQVAANRIAAIDEEIAEIADLSAEQLMAESEVEEEGDE